MIFKRLNNFPVRYSIGLAFLAAVSVVEPSLWTEKAAGADLEGSLSLTDDFICRADPGNSAREPEYVTLAAAMNREAEAIRLRYLSASSRDALRAMLEAQHPDRLTEDPDTGALTAMWGRDNPQNAKYIILDRDGGPAYLQIDLSAGLYTEWWMREGVFWPQGRPSITEITPDGMTQQWMKDKDPSNQTGPAILTLSNAEHTLDLSWYVDGMAVYINGRPTRIQMDTATGIVFHEEYGAGGGPDRRMIHRKADHLNILDRDRQSGQTVRAFYMYHSADPRSDEVTREIKFDNKTGLMLGDVWKRNGQAIARPSVLPGYDR
jgi:hypothetical protein